MKKAKDKRKISLAILILCIALLSIIVFYFKFISGKEIYASNIQNEKEIINVSTATIVNIENIIKNNASQISYKEEIYEKQEFLKKEEMEFKQLL